MIDFDALVLNPCMKTLAVRVLFTLTETRPGDPPFEGVGIYSSNPLDVALQDDGIFSDQQTTLGIQISQFEFLPDRQDQVEILEGPAAGRKFWIGDQDLDGQGGAVLLLRERDPQ